jgi:hypothetical protein
MTTHARYDADSASIRLNPEIHAGALSRPIKAISKGSTVTRMPCPNAAIALGTSVVGQR